MHFQTEILINSLIEEEGKMSTAFLGNIIYTENTENIVYLHY